MVMEAEEGGMCRTGKMAAENPAPTEDSGTVSACCGSRCCEGVCAGDP